MNNEKSIVLVGLGPHSKRIYMSFLSKLNIWPKLIVDLESKENDVISYLEAYNLHTKCIFIPDEEKDFILLSDQTKEKIKTYLKEFDITHAVISTEPKAHNAYINFFLDNNISILTDKPITAPIDVSNDEKMAERIESDYYSIIDKYLNVKNNGILLEVQCQRRWHLGYKFLYGELQNIVIQYGVPITSIQITHSDGMWNMPDEFIFRENHPYKYGYGKLYHSGYHFIDLLSWIVSINDQLPAMKAKKLETYASIVRPSDFLHMVNNDFYNTVLKTEKFNHIFNDIDNLSFNKYGEIDVYSIIKFMNNNDVITTATLSLIQNGFSRRSWDTLPQDTYKGNGRVRHEYLNVEVGPLMNIQVHSYQAKEIKDRNVEDSCATGECEHFDIYIFKNIDILGGVPFEKISIADLIKNESINDFMGYNEYAREKCFLDFLNNKSDGTQIFSHGLGIKIMRNIYESICAYAAGENPVIKCEVPNGLIDKGDAL